MQMKINLQLKRPKLKTSKTYNLKKAKIDLWARKVIKAFRVLFCTYDKDTAVYYYYMGKI